MYKKFFSMTIPMILTTAATTGITFAASNPFSDVPTDSWAYEAVNQLAHDGVIDGYPDGTYRGQKNMTRFEMAQIVARAMTKTDLSKADKATVDKLAAEFSEELNNLGVRVSDLEKKSDNLKWSGKLKYKYKQQNHDVGKDKRSNKIEVRMEPKAYIGDTGWTANARIKYVFQPEEASNADMTVDRAYVKGPLFGTTVTAGLTPIDVTQGVLFDDALTGITSEFGSDVFNTKIYLGRYSEIGHDNKEDNQSNKDITANYYGVQFDYTPTDKLSLNAGYINLNGLDNNKLITVKGNEANIWYAGTDYEFIDNLHFVGEFVQNTDAEKYKNAYFMELRYKEAKAHDPGSWGMYAGYRSFGDNVTIETNFDDADANQKGFVLGASYTFADNIMGQLQYFNGKDISTDTDADTVYGNIEFKF
ncbi:MAG TPA: putative porin [Candidatus Megamonas gallistercoris]|nr:putative porin [Candidatus Megamonas gallistercoris]